MQKALMGEDCVVKEAVIAPVEGKELTVLRA